MLEAFLEAGGSDEEPHGPETTFSGDPRDFWNPKTIKGRSYRFSVIAYDSYRACLWVRSLHRHSSSVICEHIKFLSCPKYAAHTIQTFKHRDSFPRRRNSDLGFYSVFQIALDLCQAVLYRDFYDCPHTQLKRASWKMPNLLSNEKSRKGSYTCIGLDSMHWINTVIYYKFFNSELLFKFQCLSCSSYWNGEKNI